MAKRATKVREAVTPEAMRAISSAFLEEVITSFQQEYNDPNISMLGDAGKLIVGVPIDYLPFEYLIQNNVIPLSRVLVIVGTEGTFKSALNFEIGRWFRRVGGIATIFETESKFSEDQATSIMGWNDPKGMAQVTCASVEDWQEKMQAFIQRVVNRQLGGGGEKGQGRTFPVFMCLDSLMGKLSEETNKTIESDGHSGRRFAFEAMLNTDFVKKIAGDLVRLPIAWSIVNHLKKSVNARGMPERTKTGGKLVNFQETFELQLDRNHKFRSEVAGDEKTKRSPTTIRTLDIRCFKNSLGETDRQITVDMKWWEQFDPTTGTRRQLSMWDWYGSTIKLLESFEGYDLRRVKEVVDINKKTRSDKRIGYWSKSLGIPESDPQLATDFGKLLHEDEDMLEALRDVLSIKRRKTFETGVDYFDQIEKLRSESKHASDKKAKAVEADVLEEPEEE